MLLPWLLIVIALPALAASPWEGEWEATVSPAERYGVSIENCDADGRCWVETFQFKSAGDAACRNRARSEKNTEPGSTTLQVGMDEGRCVLVFHKASDGDRAAVLTLQAGEKSVACPDSCSAAPVKARDYQLLSAKPFHTDARENKFCHSPLTRVARFWCTGENVEEWENQAIASAGATVGDQTDKWRAEMKSTWLKATLKKCERANSVSNCVHDQYVKMGKKLKLRKPKSKRRG